MTPGRTALAYVAALIIVDTPMTGVASAQSDDGLTAGLPTTSVASPPADAGPTPIDAGAANQAPEIEILRERAQRVRDLLANALDPGVDATSLFDVSLQDERAVRVEAERLRAVVERGEPRALVPDAAPTSSTRDAHRKPPRRGPTSVDAGPVDAGIYDSLGELDGPLYTARLELDRARLQFYALPKQLRDGLLERHAERQRAAAAAQTAAAVNEAEKRASAAEDARLRAVEAARQAKTEMERLVAEENARLLGVFRAQAEFEAQLIRADQDLKGRSERTVALRLRVREALAGRSPPATTDALYDELRSWLRGSRDELATAISQASRETAVPELGKEPAASLTVDLDRGDIERKVHEIEETAQRLHAQELALRSKRAGQLYDEVRALNGDRLSLLRFLTSSKRSAIVGFGAAGLDQAGAELRQIGLVLRYHLGEARRFVSTLRTSSELRTSFALSTGLVALKWLLAIAAFVWWRRRAEPVLARWHQRISEERRGREARPSRLVGLIGLARHVHRPLTWLLLCWALVALLPTAAASQLEVTLLTTIFVWTLGGALVVATIDGLVGEAGEGRRRSQTHDAALRLRSLKLIGRTVVAFGLILALSSSLVGKGTIHSWVFSTCWLAAIPVAIVLVHWWRKTIFERINLMRKKDAFARWAITRRQGWRSFPAAVAAGAYLFLYGTARAAQRWVGGFDLTRRALAYLFRRGLDRLAEDKADLAFTSLLARDFTTLGPETPSVEILAEAWADQDKVLAERIHRGAGGVFAVVGERGGGKSTLLVQIRATDARILLLDCSERGPDDLARALARSLDVPEGASLEHLGGLLDAPERATGLLIDNAHLLIKPVMGGLAAFDRLLAVARANSTRCTWVFAIDKVIWDFFERARGARPLFDDVTQLGPWREEAIARLLAGRSRQAGLQPSFVHLVERLPPDTDDQDRVDALERTAGGYYRMLWDYSIGNPGIALHIWRHQLGVDPSGRLCVKPFQAPDGRDLDSLPDPAIFVVRAVMQLQPALSADIVRATMLPLAQVEDALRYGLGRGYFDRAGDRYHVTWGWLRAISRFLQRRHLLHR